jgi:hypothetical protein
MRSTSLRFRAGRPCRCPTAGRSELSRRAAKFTNDTNGGIPR